MKESRRQSLSYRLTKARKDHELDDHELTIRHALEIEEIKLNQLNRENLADYRDKIKESRRVSLEYRNQTAVS